MSFVDYARVRSLAERVGAIVIEDATHSLGGSYTIHGRGHRGGE